MVDWLNEVFFLRDFNYVFLTILTNHHGAYFVGTLRITLGTTSRY